MLLFDIGANIGKWALANYNNSTKIISVEASPFTFSALQKNVERFPNIIPLHYALSPSNESHVTFYHCHRADTLSTLNKDWLSSPLSRFGDYKDSIQEIRVPSISLDTLIDKYGIPDILKIDVEGAEHIVLQSLTKKVPILCFEWASEWQEFNIQNIHQLTALGFTQFAIQYEDKYDYRPSEFPLNASQIITILSNTTPKNEWGMVWAK